MGEAYSPQKTSSGLDYESLTATIVKGSTDKRDYHVIRLSNLMEVLLISDPQTDKSAAALDVYVGSQSDPVELPGLAHLCEHLLFMGNEKYPKENDYSEYLSENGGFSNAFTAFDRTNYYFEVGTSHLEGALDRFSQFFVSSLFSESCTEREINAVDSENKKNLQSDNWRISQLQKSLSRPDHPYSSFATGNLETLLETPKSQGIDTREELLKFYKKYYSANLMKLVVSGKESIEQLIELVVPRFSQVENKNLPAPTVKGSPFSSDSHAIKLSVVPVKDSRTLEIQFEIPSQMALYDSKPASYLSHLIGHEGPGSILSLLKSKGWVTELYSSAGSDFAEFAIFEISVELTPEGYEHTEGIIEIIFQYIELLKQNGINKVLFDEFRIEMLAHQLKSLRDLAFRFQEKSNISNYVSYLAGILQRPLPRQLVLASSSVFAKFGPADIRQTLDCLDPRKMRVVLISKEIQKRGDLKTERWYGTQHCIEPIDPGFIKRLMAHKPNPALHLPYPNPFVPTNFELVNAELATETHPVLLARDPLNTVWYHRGLFEVPRVSMCMFIQNLYAYATPRLFVCLELLKDIVTENLAEYGYDAQMAGLNYELDVQYRGINIMVHGYNHKLEKLLFEITGHLKAPKIAISTFNMCKEKMVRSLKNSRMNAPVNHAGYFTSYSMLEKMWTNEEKAAEAPHVTVEELALFAKSFFSRAHVETLVVGNYTPQDCLKMVSEVQAIFGFSPLHVTELPTRRNVQLNEPSCSLVHEMEVFDPSNVNSAIEFYLDIYAYSDIELRAYTELVCHLISEPAFNQLRTVEQLGYIVFGGSRNLASRGGVRILIQSERDPAYLESRIESFLVQFKDQVMAYSPEEFQSRTQSLIDHKLKKDENLGQLIRRDWGSISSRFYDFDSIQKLVEVLKIATQEKTIAIIDEYMLKGSPRRRKFSLHLRSQKLPTTTLPDAPKLEDCGTIIRNIVDWKLTQHLSPAPVALSQHEVYPLNSTKLPEGKKANL